MLLVPVTNATKALIPFASKISQASVDASISIVIFVLHFSLNQLTHIVLGLSLKKKFCSPIFVLYFLAMISSFLHMRRSASRYGKPTLLVT